MLIERVLDVGCGPVGIQLPHIYSGSTIVRLDSDPTVSPDVLCDLRELSKHVEKNSFDAVRCSHTFEHFYEYEGLSILRSFMDLLKPDGFVDLTVPDVQAALVHMASVGDRLDYVAYDSPAGPIRYLDMIYGHQPYVQQNPNYQHKIAYNIPMLNKLFVGAGAYAQYAGSDGLNVRVFAFRDRTPPRKLLVALGVIEDQPEGVVRDSK